MSAPKVLTGSIAANKVLTWMRTWYQGEEMPEATDLDVVRQILPDTPYGQGVRQILKPMPLIDGAFEGVLARDPDDPEVWGIAYSSQARPERQRFTIAHELGHFVLHRNLKPQFNCDQQSVHPGIDTLRDIEREANDFASNLLMPGDLLRKWISSQSFDLHVLSGIAKRFQVSFEALCIRFIEFTTDRAILICWDNGFAKYVCRSQSARKSRLNIRLMSDPAEPPPGTLAADASITQEWDGIDMSAARWCPGEARHMSLREFKHSYSARERVLTLLLLESAEPPSWDRSWQDEESFDSFDQFIYNGQHPV